MKWSNTWMLLVIACCVPRLARAQLEIVTNAGPQCVFFGEVRKISVTLHNPGGQDFEGDIRTRIFQANSATAVQLSEAPWKKLQVLPGQTVLESARLDFPAVRAETRFLVQWLADGSGTGFQPVAAQKDGALSSGAEQTGKMPVLLLGTTEVFVYPTNLLAELKPLAGDEALGIFDPLNQLKPLLKNLKIDFVNLENADLENFSGKLAIIGPFQSKAQMRDGLASQIKALAKKGAAIVWLQPSSEPSPRPSPVRREREKLQPSFYSVSVNTNAVVIVQPELVANLPENPQSQLNLIYFCKLASQPEIFHLPNSTIQP